jgi:hypothetical protein
MSPNEKYPLFKHDEHVKKYLSDYKHITKCRNSDIIKFEYDGNIVQSYKYNQEAENIKWYEKLENETLKYYDNNKTDINSDNYLCKGIFYTDSLPNKKGINLLASYLKNMSFFNFKTLIFMIKINGYNINKNIFINLNLIFEQTDVGKIETSYKVCTLNVLSDLSDLKNLFNLKISSLINVLIFLFLCLYTFYSIYDLFMEAVENVKQTDFRRGAFRVGKSFKDIWFYFKMIQTLLFFMTLSLRIYLYVNLIPIFSTIKHSENNSEDSNYRYLDVENKCSLLSTVTLMETFIICCTLLYFLRYLERNIIKPVSDTIIESYLQIIVFFTSYILIILGFSFFCHYIFGIKEQSNLYKFILFYFIKPFFIKYFI